MKLLVNLSMLGPQPTGLGVYAGRCALAASAAFDAEVVAPPSYRGGAHVASRSPQNIVLGAGRAAPLRRWVWARRRARTADRLVYSPTHHGFAGEERQILTIHDLIALRFPKQHPVQHLFFRHLLPSQLKRCRAVFTVSQTTRADIHAHYGYPLASIHVVPNGVDREVFRRAPDEAPRDDFLLMVGAGYPHKNVDEVLERAALWKGRYRLLIASCRGAYRQHLQAQVQRRGLEAKVRFLDYVEPAELVRLYQRCAAFLYPSRWEGFGIPPLEALACGARVIASDIPAHREVLGSAATLVTLGDAASWEAAFAALDAPVPAPGAGPGPLDRFTWRRSAEALVAAIESVEPGLARRP
jgi:glycosyltransferase involved in cell wall biosynthesis